jgi:type IV pilus assembly protein PilP
MTINRNAYSVTGLLLLLATLFLSGCSNNEEMIDLQNYVQRTVNRPPGQIEPIPEFKSYEPFQYSASSLRSPFDIPLDITLVIRNQSNNVKPDENRPKELLENYPLSTLTMVGSIARGETMWALILDETGLVTRVTVGNHMGRNYGRIVDVSENQVELTEIVPTGDGSWMERPQTMLLREEGP